MSLSSIRIYRDLPVVAGYVQIPPCRETEKTKSTAEDAETAIAGSVLTNLSLGSGRLTGAHFGAQEFLRLPAITPGTWYTSDPVAALG